MKYFLRAFAPLVATWIGLVLPFASAWAEMADAGERATSNWHASISALAVEGGEVPAYIKGDNPNGVTATRGDDSRAGVRLATRWRWHSRWSVEAAYVRLGAADAELGGASNSQIFAAGEHLHPQSASGLSAGLLHHWALGRGMRFSLGGGAWAWRAEWDLTRGSTTRDYHKTSSDLFASATLDFPGVGDIHPRLRWDRYKLDNGEIDSFGIELEIPLRQ